MLTIHKPTRGSSSLFCIFCTKDFYKCGHNNVLELPNIDTRPGPVFIPGLLLIITNTFGLNINALTAFFPSLCMSCLEGV